MRQLAGRCRHPHAVQLSHQLVLRDGIDVVDLQLVEIDGAGGAEARENYGRGDRRNPGEAEKHRQPVTNAAQRLSPAFSRATSATAAQSSSPIPRASPSMM